MVCSFFKNIFGGTYLKRLQNQDIQLRNIDFICLKIVVSYNREIVPKCVCMFPKGDASPDKRAC